jgi:hypothetical protein
VYSVLTKDDDGTYSVLSKTAQLNFAERVANQIKGKRNLENTDDGFLIYIVNQEALFNDEISTITYFKDITFGVLYEQVKAQQELQNAISGALQSKMSKPLSNIVRNCKEIEKSQDLKKFEAEQGQNFRKLIVSARLVSNHMVIHL